MVQKTLKILCEWEHTKDVHQYIAEVCVQSTSSFASMQRRWEMVSDRRSVSP